MTCNGHLFHKWRYDLSWRGFQYRTCVRCGMHQVLESYTNGSVWERLGCKSYQKKLERDIKKVEEIKQKEMGKDINCPYCGN